jgi:hypothetical protein
VSVLNVKYVKYPIFLDLIIRAHWGHDGQKARSLYLQVLLCHVTLGQTAGPQIE